MGKKILLLKILKKKISKQQKDEEHLYNKAELREEKKSETKNGKKQKISNKNIK